MKSSIALAKVTSDLVGVINAMVNDFQVVKNSSTLLIEKCVINLATGAITDYDADDFTIKNASDTVPETGNLKSNFTDTTFTVDDLKVTLFQNLVG